MAIEFNWKINQFDTYKEQDGKTNVIYAIHWSYIGQEQIDENDPEAPVYFDSCVGSQEMEVSDDFIEFDDITKEIVIGWLEEKINVDYMKNKITENINHQKAPLTNHIKPNFE
jgi:hypothetical protein|tara:strand:- start:146 stop:484 length:339 start_codon:yes stop_codon:yes gene_type:complete